MQVLHLSRQHLLQRCLSLVFNVAQAGMGFGISLPLPVKCWDYRPFPTTKFVPRQCT